MSRTELGSWAILSARAGKKKGPHVRPLILPFVLPRLLSSFIRSSMYHPVSSHILSYQMFAYKMLFFAQESGSGQRWGVPKPSTDFSSAAVRGAKCQRLSIAWLCFVCFDCPSPENDRSFFQVLVVQSPAKLCFVQVEEVTKKNTAGVA